MNPKEFVKTEKWKERRNEVMLEIFAVFLPIIVYASSLVIGELGVRPKMDDPSRITSLSHFLGIPDAIFGACVLFAFSLIQGNRHRRSSVDKNNLISDEIFFWKLAGVSGFIVSILMAGVSIIFHGYWAFGLGIPLLYFSGLCYMKIIFYRTYLDIVSTKRTNRPPEI